ncbi:MAG: DUF763 domain-containing protein [Candidatus Micrarchaeia archaeon]
MQSITYLPLHGGQAPRWLYARMVKLAGAIGEVILDEFGPDDLLRRLADPNWLQALSCTIGYDWHSSGTTTVTMAAMKEALNESGEIFIAGGKGKTGLRTPEDIIQGVDKLSIPAMDKKFAEASRLAAKIDSSMVYDDISIYHHTFSFSKNGKWVVVQQAMQAPRSLAIRFQVYSELLDAKDIANEFNSAIAAPGGQQSLDLTYSVNAEARLSLTDALGELVRIVSYPNRHTIIPQIDLGKRGIEAVKNASELNPKDYKELLLSKGIGRKTLRSLAFVSSLIFGKELAYRDPVAYAYNVGGKDGIPFRINKESYDNLIAGMRDILDSARIENREKLSAMKRLAIAMEVK